MPVLVAELTVMSNSIGVNAVRLTRTEMSCAFNIISLHLVGLLLPVGVQGLQRAFHAFNNTKYVLACIG
jgi:hypothetical protein